MSTLKQIKDKGEERAEQISRLPKTGLIRFVPVVQHIPVIPRHPATNIGE